MAEISKITGMPKRAVAMKKYWYPKWFTKTPENPAKNLGIKSITELKIAYCVAE